MPELRGALAALFTCDAPEVLVEGRAGTSKTTGILTKIIHRAQAYPDSRHLIVRQTRTSLTESVMVTFDRLVGPGHPAYREVQRTNRHDNTFPNGSSIVWGGLDKPETLFSTEWDTVYLAEATEAQLEPWDLFGRAMRHNKTPYHQRIADCNPGPPGHWLNKRAIAAGDRLRDLWHTPDEYNELQAFNHYQATAGTGRPMRRLISVHQDNPAYWDMEAWDWTKLGREYVMGTLAGMSGHRRARMFDGRWKAAEGSVFPEFDEARHVVKPFPIPSTWPVYVGLDPGYDHPCSILWVALSPTGKLIVVDEVYQGGRGVPEHAEEIKRRNPGRNVLGYYADPQHAFNHTAQSPESIADQFQKCGLSFFPWPRSTDVAAMVEAVRDRLKAGTLWVFSNCTSTIEEFQGWRYKRTAKGELPTGDDQFEDRMNHSMDVVKGLVACGLSFKLEKIQVYG